MIFSTLRAFSPSDVSRDRNIYKAQVRKGVDRGCERADYRGGCLELRSPKLEERRSLQSILFSEYYLCDFAKKFEMGEICRKRGCERHFTQNFSSNICRQDTYILTVITE